MNFLKKKLISNNDIFTLKVTDSDTHKVTNFYKISPFPNYKIDDNKQSILEKGDKNLLAKQFKKFMGLNKKVLEVGCGTGQLSNYFAIGTNNEIIAFDPTIESLNLAKNFADKNNLINLKFVNADIFDDVLKDNYFDFIWCNGVLHHTKDPYRAFQLTCNYLKNDGYILIGLYNKIGRIRTIVRKYLGKIFGIKIIEYLDPTLKKLKLNHDEKQSWINDQYFHPIESLHTLDEVLGWFKNNKIEYIDSIPSCDFENINSYENIFSKKNKGDLYSRLYNQFAMLFNKLGSDGGLFIVIGKKVEI